MHPGGRPKQEERIRATRRVRRGRLSLGGGRREYEGVAEALTGKQRQTKNAYILPVRQQKCPSPNTNVCETLHLIVQEGSKQLPEGTKHNVD